MSVPGRLDKFFRNYVSGHTKLYQPCTSATVFEGSPFPLVQQMILHQHKKPKKNSPIHDEQGKSAMVASAYPQMPGSVQ